MSDNGAFPLASAARVAFRDAGQDTQAAITLLALRLSRDKALCRHVALRAIEVIVEAEQAKLGPIMGTA